MVISGEGPLSSALRQVPQVGVRALEMLSRPSSFKADEEENKAFFLIFSLVRNRLLKLSI
jgi:hypothetical protein